MTTTEDMLREGMDLLQDNMGVAVVLTSPLGAVQNVTASIARDFDTLDDAQSSKVFDFDETDVVITDRARGFTITDVDGTVYTVTEFNDSDGSIKLTGVAALVVP